MVSSNFIFVSSLVKCDSLIDKFLGDKSREKHRTYIRTGYRFPKCLFTYEKRQNIPFYINHFQKGTG